MISFTVFVNPVAKGRPRVTTRGRFPVIYTPKETKEAQNLFISKAKVFKPNEPLKGALKVTINFYKIKPKSYPKKVIHWITKPDIDNLQKLYLDSMNKIFYHDDSQVVELISTKKYSDIARVEITIESII